MRAIAIINQKGGCGKTTSAINLAAVLARAGKRVLLIDMDPQGHCAAGLGIPEQRLELDIGDAMLAIGSKPIDPAKLLWRAVRNLDLAPARMKLAGLEAARGGLADLPDKERRLTAVLEKFSSDYDIAVVDCPPSIGLLTFNALAAADMVVIPVETGFFSLQGATRQVNTVKTLSKRLGVNLPVWLMPTLHESKNTVAADLLEELHRRFKDRVTPVVIRHDVRLREAASFGQTIIDYAPGSMGAEDYGRLGIWVLENLKQRAPLPADQLETVIAGAEVHVSSMLVTAGGVHTTTTSNGHGPTITNGAHAAAADALAANNNGKELKPVSRAEDVARRAQEFLRRIALGRGTPVQPANGAAASVTSADAAHSSGTSTALATEAGTRTTTLTAPSASIVSQTLAAPAPTKVPAGVVLQEPRQVLRVIDESVGSQPIAPSTQRLLGIRETSQGMLFVQPMSSGQRLAIAGDFNGWSPSSHVMKRNEALGIFELCLRLPAGKFSYRLVVDGAWKNDPYNTNTEPNPFGELNNIGYVGHS